MTTATKAGGAVLPVEEFKAGNEFARYHPQASHVSPDYRDGWNHCFTAAQATIDELRDEVERLTRERDEASQDLAALRAFTGEVMGDWPDVGGLDGFDLQGIGEKTGLLRRETRVAPCSERCACVEFDSGEVECWRVEPVLQRAREALRASLLGDGGTL